MRSLAFSSLALAGVVIDHGSDIQPITDKTFGKVVEPARTLSNSLVMYYSAGDDSQVPVMKTYGELATKYKGWFVIGAIDCDKHAKLCKSQSVSSFPSLMFYPMQPMPKYKYEGAMTVEAIGKAALKAIPSVDTQANPRVKEVADLAAFRALAKSNPKLVKVVLFNLDKDKKKPAAIYKALSTDTVFARTCDFRFVRPDQEDIIKAAGANAKRRIVLYYGQGNSLWYNDDMSSFAKLYEWINIYQESGTGDTVKGASGAHEAAEEADVGPVAEWQAATSKECFGQTSICAVYLSNGPPTGEAVEEILAWEASSAPKKDRGVKFSWMFMDMNEETGFKDALQTFEDQKADNEGYDKAPLALPSLMLVKPPKKKREESKLAFIKMPNEEKLTAATVADLVGKAAGGPMFSRVNMPNFAPRKRGERKNAPKKEEL